MSVKTTYRKGRTEVDARAYQEYFVRKEVAYSDAVSNVVRVPLPANVEVLGVRFRVKTAFAGGSPTVTMGDTASAVGWFAAGDSTITNANQLRDSRLIAANAYQAGRYYAAANQLVITFSASLTAGALTVDIIFSGAEAARKDMVENLS